jgi:hypothetical protein
MKLILALNSINPQVWAFLILLTGCVAVLTFHKAGIDIGIAAGIIGAGVQMFTSSGKAQDHPPNPQPPADPAPTK